MTPSTQKKEITQQPTKVVELRPSSRPIPLSQVKLVLPSRNGEIRKLIDEFIDELHELKDRKPVARNKVEYYIDKCLDALSKPSAIWGQGVALLTYATFNSLTIFGVLRFDPYPFLFLNTLFSIISGFTTVIVLNSNHRQDIASKSQAELNIKGLELTLKLLESIDAKLNNGDKNAGPKE